MARQVSHHNHSQWEVGWRAKLRPSQVLDQSAWPTERTVCKNDVRTMFLSYDATSFWLWHSRQIWLLHTLKRSGWLVQGLASRGLGHLALSSYALTCFPSDSLPHKCAWAHTMVWNLTFSLNAKEGRPCTCLWLCPTQKLTIAFFPIVLNRKDTVFHLFHTMQARLIICTLKSPRRPKPH